MLGGAGHGGGTAIRVLVQVVIVRFMNAVLMRFEGREPCRIGAHATGCKQHGDHENVQKLAGQLAHDQRETRRFAGGQAADWWLLCQKDVAV